MKWILFDAYGTLFDAGKINIRKIAEEIADRFKIDYQVIFDIWTTKYIEIERGTSEFRTITETNRESLAFVFEELSLGEDYEFYVKRMNDEWSKPRLLPGVFELVEWLINQRCRIGIVSNSDDITLFAAVKNTKLPIDNIVSSEMAESYKPENKIFEYALKKWNCTPEQCIYIGNSRNDVMAATSFGIECIYLSSENYFVSHDNKGIYRYYLKSIFDCFDYLKTFLDNYNVDELRKINTDYSGLFLSEHEQRSIDRYYSDRVNLLAREQALDTIKRLFVDCPRVYQELYLEPAHGEKLTAVLLDYWTPGGYGNSMSYGMGRFKISSYEEFVANIVCYTLRSFLSRRDFTIIGRYVMRKIGLNETDINEVFGKCPEPESNQ